MISIVPCYTTERLSLPILSLVNYCYEYSCFFLILTLVEFIVSIDTLIVLYKAFVLHRL